MSPETVGTLIGIAVLVVVPAVITGMKGKPGMVLAGLVIMGVFLWVGSIRLAKPGSWWYEHRYGHAKRKRAWERFESTPYVADRESHFSYERAVA